jgi:hypothetical protein
MLLSLKARGVPEQKYRLLDLDFGVWGISKIKKFQLLKARQPQHA